MYDPEPTGQRRVALTLVHATTYYDIPPFEGLPLWSSRFIMGEFDLRLCVS